MKPGTLRSARWCYSETYRPAARHSGLGRRARNGRARAKQMLHKVIASVRTISRLQPEAVGTVAFWPEKDEVIADDGTVRCVIKNHLRVPYTARKVVAGRYDR